MHTSIASVTERCTVIAFYHTTGYFVCAGCSLSPDIDAILASPQAVYDHLIAHTSQGDKVPQRVFSRLTTLMEEDELS